MKFHTLSLFVLLLTVSLEAAEYRWTGTVSGDWLNAANWSPNGLNLAGSELSGSGAFIGSVTNNGVVRPGNSAGLLTFKATMCRGRTALWT